MFAMDEYSTPNKNICTKFYLPSLQVIKSFKHDNINKFCLCL